MPDKVNGIQLELLQSPSKTLRDSAVLVIPLIDRQAQNCASPIKTREDS
jgi:hypothetical protein